MSLNFTMDENSIKQAIQNHLASMIVLQPGTSLNLTPVITNGKLSVEVALVRTGAERAVGMDLARQQMAAAGEASGPGVLVAQTQTPAETKPATGKATNTRARPDFKNRSEKAAKDEADAQPVKEVSEEAAAAAAQLKEDRERVAAEAAEAAAIDTGDTEKDVAVTESPADDETAVQEAEVQAEPEPEVTAQASDEGKPKRPMFGKLKRPDNRP